MSEYNNAKCSICGKPYHICDSCAEQKQFKPWRTITDSINCYKIYTAISDYNNKHISKDEARDYLSKCNLNEYKNYLPEIVLVIDEILKIERKTYKRNTVKEVSEKNGDKNSVDKDNE